MNVKASGRSALIIAAGFWLCVAGPLQAAQDADGGTAEYKTEAAPEAPVVLSKFTKRSGQWKHAATHRKSVKVASRNSTERTKTSEKKISEKKKTLVADAALSDDGSAPSLPPSVANANAQLAAADVPPDSPNSVSTKAGNMLRAMAAKQGDAAEPPAPAPAANTELVAADQLNDVDRALSDSKSEDKPALAPTVAMAMAQAPAAVSIDDSAWGQTSLVGKLFIAFGALLTMASAARMFMA
jgi:hypothetical protein